jgi:hypothetical protein
MSVWTGEGIWSFASESLYLHLQSHRVSAVLDVLWGSIKCRRPSAAWLICAGRTHEQIPSCKNTSYQTFRPHPHRVQAIYAPVRMRNHQIPRQSRRTARVKAAQVSKGTAQMATATREEPKFWKRSRCSSWATNVLLDQNCYSTLLI